jgi:hypothetical protein
MSDAGSNVVCVGGSVPSGCGGAAVPPECHADADCRTDGGARVCTKPVCSQAGGCGCSGGGKCVDPGCTTDPDCHGPNQACQDSVCVTKACTGDSDCMGFCVNGLCSSSLGACGRQQFFP